MKKWLIGLSIAIMLGVSPTISTFARAGGAVGGGTVSFGGSHSTGGGSTSTGNAFYNRGIYFGRPGWGYGHGGIFNWLGVLVPIVFLGYGLRRRTKQQLVADQQPHDVGELGAELANEFEPLFYAVENAWVSGNKAELQRLMTPKYFKQQQIILNNWRQEGKVNKLDNLVIVKLQREYVKADELHVVVTAQARDYFQYPDRADEYNQYLQDNTMIQRFTEVWELVKDNNGQYLVNNIRQAAKK